MPKISKKDVSDSANSSTQETQEKSIFSMSSTDPMGNISSTANRTQVQRTKKIGTPYGTKIHKHWYEEE